jgi:ABC-type transport system involved in multi-copper enzyme maturation permease subunit
MNAFVIARLTFLEASRRKILLAAMLLGFLFLLIFGIGFHFILREMENSPYGPGPLQTNEISGFLFQAGMYVVNFLTVMMTVLTSVDTISGEVQSGTIHTLVSKPVRRWEILIGKWIGFAGMISLYLLLMAGGITAIVTLRSGYHVPHPVNAFGLMLLNALILLSISLLGGTFLSTLANGVLVFGLFGVAFIGGWIEQIGSFLPDAVSRQSAVNIGILTSLILPSEALWKRAAIEIQSPLISALGFSPFSSISVPSPMMVYYSIFFLFAILLIAIRQFQHRDL